MNTPVSPKVKWGALGGLSAALGVAVLSALLLNPTGLGFTLPTWVLFLLAAAGPVLIQTLTGFQVRDPLRAAGATSLETGENRGEHLF